jgi:hypothetical protein
VQIEVQEARDGPQRSASWEIWEDILEEVSASTELQSWWAVDMVWGVVKTVFAFESP